MTLYKLGRFDHLSRSSYFTRISSILISTISRQNKAPRRMFNCDDCSGPMYQLASPVRTEWGREEENSPPPLCVVKSFPGDGSNSRWLLRGLLAPG